MDKNEELKFLLKIQKKNSGGGGDRVGGGQVGGGGLVGVRVDVNAMLGVGVMWGIGDLNQE